MPCDEQGTPPQRLLHSVLIVFPSTCRTPRPKPSTISIRSGTRPSIRRCGGSYTGPWPAASQRCSFLVRACLHRSERTCPDSAAPAGAKRPPRWPCAGGPSGRAASIAFGAGFGAGSAYYQNQDLVRRGVGWKSGAGLQNEITLRVCGTGCSANAIPWRALAGSASQSCTAPHHAALHRAVLLP